MVAPVDPHEMGLRNNLKPTTKHVKWVQVPHRDPYLALPKPGYKDVALCLHYAQNPVISVAPIEVPFTRRPQWGRGA